MASTLLSCPESGQSLYLCVKCNWEHILVLESKNNGCEHGSPSVERVATANLPTQVGDFKIAGYRSLNSTEEFVVLFKGELRSDTPTLVRIHSQCLTGDVFGSIKCDCGLQLKRAMEMIEA